MKIGELSKQSGVSIDTIRYYERRGLIPAATRTTAGYRQYAAADLSRLKFILQSKYLGFTLEEISQLLTLRSGDRKCVEVRAAAEAKAAEIGERMLQLDRMRDILLTLAKECAQSSDDDPCPILKSLEK